MYTNTVYEFQGCIWHGHRCWMTKKHNGVNPVNGKNLDDLYQRTQDTNGLTGLQTFPLQPIDGHTLIPSGRFPPEACFFFSENEMSSRHVLHD
jgi:hypothetical protein